jgi:thiol-disulfide isomerase/thioredoxin
MSSPKPTKGRPVSRVDAARSGGTSPLPIVVIAVVVVVVIGIGVVIALRAGGGDDGGSVDAGTAATSPAAGEQAFAPVEVEGEPVPDLDDVGDDDPALGQPAPSLTGETPGGEPITVDPAADGPMLLVFVAHWCPHCQAEVPRIVELYGGESELDGVELVAVATGSNPSAPEYPPGEWLAGEGWPGRTMVDDEQATAFTTYGGGSYPYIVAIDADGNVVARASGEQGEDALQGLVDAAAGTSG